MPMQEGAEECPLRWALQTEFERHQMTQRTYNKALRLKSVIAAVPAQSLPMTSPEPGHKL